MKDCVTDERVGEATERDHSSLEENLTVLPEDGPASVPAKGIAVSALAIATAACGGGDSGGGSSPPTGSSSGGTVTPPPPTVLKPATDEAAARFALRAAFSAPIGSISNLKDQGYEPWLDGQMSASNDQTAEQFFQSRGFDDITTDQFFFNRRIGDHMIWSQLMSRGSEVRKRAALALSEFFVVSLNSVSITWRSQAIGEYWDILNRRAFGNFRDLLEDITLNPAMGVFLNTRGNRKANPSTGRVPDENYGREVMQLFSIGLFELNLDGTQRTDGSGNPIPTYSNDDVTGISKAFTGYDFDFDGIGYTPNPRNPNNQIPDVEYVRRPMTADPAKWQRPRTQSEHSAEEKAFLGTVIPAGTGAAETLRLTLDAIFQHPNVGPFFGKQMIQRLVTSNPSPQYVQRVAQTFNDNGSGVRGDLRAVFTAILMDEEALDPAGLTNPMFGKLREPMVRYAQWGRTFDVSSVNGNWDIGDTSSNSTALGQAPLRSPSVFNFFRPGYIPAGSQAAANNLLAPEFQLVNETSVAGYVNFMEGVIGGTGRFGRDVKASYSGELPIAHQSDALLDRLDLVLAGGQLTQNTRDVIKAALDDITVTETSDDATKLRRIHIGVMLVMASNDYMVQK